MPLLHLLPQALLPDPGGSTPVTVSRLTVLMMVVTRNFLSLEICLLGFLSKFIELYKKSPSKIVSKVEFCVFKF
jgi:hypothetical protein